MNTNVQYHQRGLVFTLAAIVILPQTASFAYHLLARRPFQSVTSPIRKHAKPTAQSGLVLKTITVPVWAAPNNKGIAPIPLSLQIINRGDKLVPIPVGALRVLLTPTPRPQLQGNVVQTNIPLTFKTGGDTGIVAPKPVMLTPGKKLTLDRFATMIEDYAQITKKSGHIDWIHAGELQGEDGNGVRWTIGHIAPGHYSLRLQLRLTDARLVTSPTVFVKMR